MRYPQDIPASNFLHIYTYGTQSRLFVHFEQLGTVQIGEIGNFCEFGPEKVISSVYHSFVNSGCWISTWDFAIYFVFLLDGQTLRSHTKFQIAMFCCVKLSREFGKKHNLLGILLSGGSMVYQKEAQNTPNFYFHELFGKFFWVRVTRVQKQRLGYIEYFC